MAGKTHSGWLRKHRSRLVVALTGIYGGIAVFGFGVLIGRLTEPVPEMPGGIHALAWLVLPFFVGMVVLPLATVRRAGSGISRLVGAERLSLVQSEPSRLTERGYGQPQADVRDLEDSALEQFPREPSVSSVASVGTAHTEVVQVA